jgi:hypothetical protein
MKHGWMPVSQQSENGKMDKHTHTCCAYHIKKMLDDLPREAVVQDFREFLVHDSTTPQQRIEFLFTLNLSA